MRRLVLASVLLSLGSFGCAMRHGMNADCHWPPDPVVYLNVQNQRDMRHLLDDIQVAEELGVRYADHAADRRPVSILGVQVRARLTAGGTVLQRLREECNAKLFGVIAASHGITLQDVNVARRRLADKGSDPAVNLPMAAFFLFVALRAIGWTRVRFETDEKWARRIAILLASLMVSASITLVGQLWGAAVEMVRVGNEHLSYRMVRLSWRQHFIEVFIIGVVSFWLLAVVEGQITPKRTV